MRYTQAMIGCLSLMKGRRWHLLFPMAALLWLGLPTDARAQALGEQGESCRARADCVEGLRCIEQVCTDAEGAEPEEAGEMSQEVADEPEGPEERPSGWSDFEMSGTHFFAGFILGPGASGWWPYGGAVDVQGALLFSLRGGVYFGRTELSVELSPVTWVPNFDADPMLSFLVSIGGLIRLGESNVFWPLRFGLGLSAINTPGDEVFMQGRLDLIGLVYQWGHLLFELDLPSVRFHSEMEWLGIWGWMFNLSVTYVI